MKKYSVCLLRAEIAGSVAQVRCLKKQLSEFKAHRPKVHEDRRPELDQSVQGLRAHRIQRREALRSLHLAHGYVQGVPYKAMEPKTDLNSWDTTRLAQAVAKHARAELAQVLAWMTAVSAVQEAA